MLPKPKDSVERRILRIISARLRDADRIADAFQQVRLTLLAMPAATEEERYRVARSVARAMQRRETKFTKTHVTLAPEGAGREPPDGSPDPETALMGLDALVYRYACHIDRLLPLLKEHQRRFLMLACEGRRMDDIRKLLELSQSATYAIRANVLRAAKRTEAHDDTDPDPGAAGGGAVRRRRKPSRTALAAAFAITKWAQPGTTALLDALPALPAFADCSASAATGVSTQALALTEGLLVHGSTAVDAIVTGATSILARLQALPAFRRERTAPEHADKPRVTADDRSVQ